MLGAARHHPTRQNPALPYMPTLTIGRMAKLYHLHRSTLYEAVEKGRVTAGFNGKGQRVVELSEMIRVYGEPPGQPEGARQNPTPLPDTRPTPDNAALLERFDALLEVVKEQRDELRALREEVHQLRRLPAPSPADTPAPANAEATPPPPAKAPEEGTQGAGYPEPGGQRQPVRSMDDVLARFESRTTKH